MNWLSGDLIGRGHMEWLEVELNVTGRLPTRDIPDPAAAPPSRGVAHMKNPDWATLSQFNRPPNWMLGTARLWHEVWHEVWHRDDPTLHGNIHFLYNRLP